MSLPAYGLEMVREKVRTINAIEQRILADGDFDLSVHMSGDGIQGASVRIRDKCMALDILGKLRNQIELTGGF